MHKVDASFSIVDNRSLNKDIKAYSFSGIDYYDYQAKTIDHTLKTKRNVIKAPTGAGKTVIMAGLVKALEGRKMVLLFNAKQLFNANI